MKIVQDKGMDGKVVVVTGATGVLCGACRFLVSNGQAGFVTGVTLPVDGGFMCYSGV